MAEAVLPTAEPDHIYHGPAAEPDSSSQHCLLSQEESLKSCLAEATWLEQDAVFFVDVLLSLQQLWQHLSPFWKCRRWRGLSLSFIELDPKISSSACFVPRLRNQLRQALVLIHLKFGHHQSSHEAIDWCRNSCRGHLASSKLLQIVKEGFKMHSQNHGLAVLQ